MGMGDELMATGLAKLLHRESGKKVMIVDARGRLRKHDIFVNNPKIVQPGQSVKDYVLLRNHSGSGRPYFSNQNDRKFILDWKSTRLNSSHVSESRMPSSA